MAGVTLLITRQTVILTFAEKTRRGLKRSNALFQRLKLLSLISVFFIVACSHSSPEKIRFPLMLDIRVDQDVNPNFYGEPAPVNIAIYRLSTFGNSDGGLTELQDFPEDNGSHRVFSAVFQPGEHRCLKLPLMPDTLAIGITGAFRDIGHAQWLSVYPLPERQALPWWKSPFIHRENALYARVHRLGLTLRETK